MGMVAFDEGVSFVSRLFKQDLDTNGWFVEFVTPDGEVSANDNLLYVDEEDLGLMPQDVDELAFIWDVNRRRRG